LVKSHYLLDEQQGEETPNKRLLGDAMAGDGALFIREDVVEAAWAVVDPVHKAHHRARPYKPGSWEPKQGDMLIAADGSWHNPIRQNLKTELEIRHLHQKLDKPIAQGGKEAELVKKVHGAAARDPEYLQDIFRRRTCQKKLAQWQNIRAWGPFPMQRV
jgi:hypothetical protein